MHVLRLLCSYRVIGRWFEVIRKFGNPDVYAVLVATKVCLINDPTSESVLIQVRQVDDSEERQVSSDEAQSLANELQLEVMNETDRQ